ncbi:MAG: hypothetical protein ABMA25_00410 [Ilumatobacteraceae bacterium]
MTHLNLVASSEPMPPNGGRIEGGSPLAGHFGLPSLLVREAVQNSWDARDDERGDVPVRFLISGWDLDTDELENLRSLLPVEALRGFTRTTDTDESSGVLHPRAALLRSSVRVLVISDRNTVGLCGPSRSGRKWDPVRHGKPLPRGQQRFANFVRNVGRATADTGSGDGGAYGVGKSALWMASECGTVLIHSRTSDEAGEPVERFIGAVHGEHFFAGDDEFTGRHFIGQPAADGVVEPVTGALAAAAAKLLPIPPYEHDGRSVDGTSIVIVAPRLLLDWELEMGRLRDAIRWYAWPKRVPGVRNPDTGPDLDVVLKWNNHSVELPAPLDDPELRPYARALLDCARDRISDDPGRDLLAECHRPKKVLGTAKFRLAGVADQNVFHLTLTERKGAITQEQTTTGDPVDDEPVVDFSAPWGQIALIRREPLLLVRYEPIGGTDDAACEVGVFLSADDPEVEEALTRAEPPAHDDWIHRIVPKDHARDHRRTIAKRTVEEVKRAKQTLLATYRTAGAGERGGGEQAVSRQISQGLLGGVGGRRLPPDPGPGPVGKRKPQAQLVPAKSYRLGSMTVHELDVTVVGIGDTAKKVLLTASGSGRDNAGPIDVQGLVSFAWFGAEGQLSESGELELSVADQSKLSLVVRVASDLRFRPKVEMEVRNAD